MMVKELLHSRVSAQKQSECQVTFSTCQSDVVGSTART